MTRVKRFNVVIATDGSRAAKAAVATAVQFPWPEGTRAFAVVAKQARADYRRSILLAALDRTAEFVARGAERALPGETRTAVSAEVRRINKERLARAHKALDRVSRTLTRAGWKVDTAITTGAPLRDLLATIANSRIDPVVVGARGVSGVRHLLLGSVAEGALNRSPVPVLIVR